MANRLLNRIRRWSIDGSPTDQGRRGAWNNKGVGSGGWNADGSIDSAEAVGWASAASGASVRVAVVRSSTTICCFLGEKRRRRRPEAADRSTSKELLHLSLSLSLWLFSKAAHACVCVCVCVWVCEGPAVVVAIDWPVIVNVEVPQRVECCPPRWSSGS